MKRKQGLVTILGICMTLMLAAIPFLGACAKPAPAPAPTAAPQPATKPHAPFEIVGLGATAGGSAYIRTAGIADMINKHSTWLKASVEETFGSADNLMKGADDPELRKRAFRVSSSPDYYDALEGNKPFPRKYTDLKAVCFSVYSPCFMASINPKIASKEGLVDKKVCVGKELSAIRRFSEFIIRDCWGMWDKIKPQPLDWTGGSKALLDGLADAMQVLCSTGIPGEFFRHPSFEELMSTRDTYFFGPTKEEVAQGNKAAKRSYAYMYVPEGSFGPKQKMGVGGFCINNTYYVYPEFPDDVVTEILRILYEYNDELPKYHASGKGMMKERLGWVPEAASINDVHPAAVKFFKERNIPLVINGGPDPAAK